MTHSHTLLNSLSEKHLLKHPFYKAWNEGKLTRQTLQTYAKQYLHHVKAFPCYLSSTHSLCTSIEDRQVLLENLIEEERGPENHPELWTRFAEALGVSREEISNEKPREKTAALVETFDSLSRSSYAEGLGALFAYEHQVPEIAATKIDGLKKFYGIDGGEGAKFFHVHLSADVYHTQEVASLIDKLSAEDKEKATRAAHKAADALWAFLDDMAEVQGLPSCAEENN